MKRVFKIQEMVKKWSSCQGMCKIVQELLRSESDIDNQEVVKKCSSCHGMYKMFRMGIQAYDIGMF